MSAASEEARQAIAEPQSARFMWLYALAWAGGAVAYVPFLSILLPAKVLQLAGDEAVSWLASIAFVGAIFASIGNIAFAWASDLTKRRTVWVILGLVLSSVLVIMSQHAQTLGTLIIVIAAWQLALNMMLGPLAAWAGDCVPDAQKGGLGGMLAFAPAMAAATATLITWPQLANNQQQLSLIAIITVLCVLPVIVFGRPVPQPALMRPKAEAGPEVKPQDQFWNPVSKMWLARLLVQVSEAALFTFLLVWLQSINPEFGKNDSARVLTMVLLTVIPVAILLGKMADRKGRAIRPLRITAATAALGLLLMAFANTIEFAIFGYFVFGVSGGVFLAIHSAQTLRVLPRPQTRGRDLGLFNLTNTVPLLVMPGITLALVPQFGFFGLFIALGCLAAVSAALLFSFSLSRRYA